MWYNVKEWVNDRNWWRIAFWTVGILEAYHCAKEEGIVSGVLQILFWWAFMSISQNIMLKDMDNGSDKQKWY
jgi:hypothetical protein